MSAYIIAEAGVNHNGSLELALRMAEAAKDCGADCVKYQTALPEALISRFAQKAEYQKQTTGGEESQLAMVRKLMLPHADFLKIQARCSEIGIQFLSTPFDLASIDFLQTLDMPFWKIPSGEITNLPYLIHIAKTRKPVVMSTGMCELSEIGAAISVLRQYGTPEREITLLHCNTEYPTPFEDVNLRAMETMRREFGLPVGYSDHTPGIAVPLAAAALGATIIEKHFTLDKSMPGPDHQASLEPDELAAMVIGVRAVERAMGSGEKHCTPSEARNKNIARKSLVAARAIRAGEPFTEENITAKRPGGGISPMRYFAVLGKMAPRDFAEDEEITV